MHLPIYLDYNATTPVDPLVLEAMLPYFNEHFGNASSKSHTYGLYAAEAVEASRKTIADFFNAPAEEFYFTSGVTESINWVIKEIIEAQYPEKDHIITSTIEHPATTESINYLAAKGINASFIPVDNEGRLDLSALEKTVTPKTALITIIAANNEIGTIQDIDALAQIAARNNVPLHLDFAQATGKVQLDLQKTPVDFLSVSSHKIYGPKGIGVFYIRKGSAIPALIPFMHGGGQEKGLRGGTLNVPSIVGVGKAIGLLKEYGKTENSRLKDLRDRLYNGILHECKDVFLNGSIKDRIVNNLNLCFPGINADTLMMNLRTIACSSGSACATGRGEASHILRAIGRSIEEARSSVRFGVGRFSTPAEIDYVVNVITETVRKMKSNV